jgi:hypothetical protein
MDFVLGSEYDAFKQMAIISRNSPIFLSMILEDAQAMNMKIFWLQSTVLPTDSLPAPIRRKLALTETIRRLTELKKEFQNGFAERVSIVLSELKSIAKKDKNEAQNQIQSKTQAPHAGGGRDGFLGF